MNHVEKLKSHSACAEAIAFAAEFKSMQKAWDHCERGDWLLWYIGRTVKTEQQRKKIVAAACKCARLSLKYVPKGEKRPLRAIQTAEAWVDGKATLGEVRAAAYAAAYASSAAYYAAASSAAAASSSASAAASSAAAYAASYAASASSAASDVARATTLKRCARIVRKLYPKPPTLPTNPQGDH